MSFSKRKRYYRPLILLLLYGGFLLFLFTTDPHKLAIAWLVVPFIWLFVTLFLTFIYIIDWFSTSHSHSRKQTTICGLLAATPAVMLLLDSVDQLTVKDFLLLLGLSLLGLFYINKISLKRDIF